MNPDLKKLQPYPFEKLKALKAGCQPAVDGHIALSIGEPKYDAPDFVLDSISDNLSEINRYPLTKGSIELRTTISNWLNRRFKLPKDALNPEQHILPVNGTREALFSFAQCIIDRSEDALILMPNPFYQIYEGAAFLSGATPCFYNTVKENNYLPDFDAIDKNTWQHCQIIYICTPGNPTGSVISKQQLCKLIELSLKHDFIIASDECYSELWFDTAPVGLLEVCAEIGRDDYKNCVVFHSLSKRSNLPGMRSGFVAGDAALLKPYLQYRTYHGAAMPVQHQSASIAAWDDEAHVEANRVQYRAKFDLFQKELGHILPLQKPDAGFYYWLKVDNDETFAKMLMEKAHVKVLPGRYLSRDTEQGNPGENHVRLALVADLAQCEQVIARLKAIL